MTMVPTYHGTIADDYNLEVLHGTPSTRAPAMDQILIAMLHGMLGGVVAMQYLHNRLRKKRVTIRALALALLLAISVGIQVRVSCGPAAEARNGRGSLTLMRPTGPPSSPFATGPQEAAKLWKDWKGSSSGRYLYLKGG